MEIVARPATNDHVIHGKIQTLKQILHLAKSTSSHHCPLVDLLNTDLQQKQILTLEFHSTHQKKKKILHVKLPGALKQPVRKKKNELYDLKIRFAWIKCPKIADNRSLYGIFLDRSVPD